MGLFCDLVDEVKGGPVVVLPVIGGDAGTELRDVVSGSLRCVDYPILVIVLPV